MAIGLSDFSTAATSLSNLVLVRPGQALGYQPQVDNEKAILFNYEGENTLTLNSDITDHFTEDNTAIQDQIALKPEEITVSGYVGELNDITPKLLNPIKIAANKLTILTAYSPALTAAALIAYNEAFFAYQVATQAAQSAVSTWNSVVNGSSENQTKQQIAFNQFFGFWSKKVLFTVQTPWAIFQNMAIKSMRAIQDDSTRMITDFELTFKRVRFAQTTVSSQKVNLSDFQGRAAAQAQPQVDLGSSTPPPATSSLTGNISGIR